MITFKDYSSYLQDNPKGYWFKRKLYGWGWTPVTWQGWLVVLGLMLIIIWTAHRLVATNNPFEYLVTLIFAVLGVIVIGYWKGESPRWQWGLKNKKTAQGSSEKRLEKKS